MVRWIAIASCVLPLSFSNAERGTVKIVGLGATTCADFTAHVMTNPAGRRDYFAWAQGFMSGILVGTPVGVDEDLDLTPPTFPLLKQVEYLLDYCAQRPSEDFSDAVVALYTVLRKESVK
jgi:hypothetical protein